MKPTFAILFATTLLAAPALAQQSPAPAPAPAAGDVLVEIERDETIVPGLGISVDELEDMRIFGANGEEIGEIDDVLGDAAGQPSAVTLEVGGFLGMGEREVVIGLDEIEVIGLRLTLNRTREQIEALPEWAD
ncbi:PRC-barrel domain-containing protein [Aquibium sp. ELW1220]|uniref:PRC-barrel domain-containing protein n=1 Tax=Aquibium sp. ELW1220 TaxID=2976766 RepID=UPI0025B01907|nr:PRC-barrel domain-containing protein [Aquibium sp. ELW1220]MDN2580676.1 PRC-barrel domain-containing protein [Aquibium sp. ELW1220]